MIVRIPLYGLSQRPRCASHRPQHHHLASVARSVTAALCLRIPKLVCLFGPSVNCAHNNYIILGDATLLPDHQPVTHRLQYRADVLEVSQLWSGTPALDRPGSRLCSFVSSNSCRQRYLEGHGTLYLICRRFIMSDTPHLRLFTLCVGKLSSHGSPSINHLN